MPRWRGDQRELFYLSIDGRLMSVEVQLGSPVRLSAPRPLFQTRIPVTGGFDQYAVTQGGERFLLLEQPGAAVVPPVTIIGNWTSLLPRR